MKEEKPYKSPTITATGLSKEAMDKFLQKKSELQKSDISVSNGDVIEDLLIPKDKNSISDGYHTFGELYEHRIVLYIALCDKIRDVENEFGYESNIWKSRKHSDGSVWDGWFLLGINTKAGKQISYHLPNKYWEQCTFEEIEQAPDFDGHTSADVLERISEL